MSKSSSFTRKLTHSALMFLLVFVTGSTSAQDTEIYFSGGTISASTDQSILPNVLFILDTSGSMTNNLTGDAQGRSRIEVLRDSMETIIAGVNNINLGLMRFTQDNGGPVLFPITYIDAALNTVISESDTNEFTTNATEDGEEILTTTSAGLSGAAGTVTLDNTTHGIADVSPVAGGSTPTVTLRIVIDDDDAEEDTDNGSMSSSAKGIDSVDLDGNSDTLNGIRFSFGSGTIPKCSEITGTTLTLRGASSDGGSANFEIRGQDSDSTNTFQEQNSNISSRVIPGSTSTTAVVPSWNVTNTFNGSTHTCDEADADCDKIDDIIEEIVNRNCTSFGATDGTWDESSLVLTFERISGSASHEFESLDGDFSDRARLDITYKAAAQAGTTKLFAIRFDELNIPQGASVDSASLCFIPSTDSSGDGNAAADFNIWGEASTNSAALTTTTGSAGLSGRSDLGTIAGWDVPNWSNNTKVCTDNSNFTGNKLEDVLEAVAGQAGWCGGNAMTLFIQTSAAGATRFAKALEADASAIELTYEYDKSASNGCFGATALNQSAISADDAQQDGATGTADINEGNIPIADQYSGYRFDAVAVPNGATIVSANLTFTANGAVATGTGVVDIKGELPADGDADEFAFQVSNISGRSTTTATSWTLPTTLADNESFTSVDIASIVTSIVAAGSWASGNAMAFILNPSTTDTDYSVHARDGDATKAARLEIAYESTGDTEFKTVRERLIELVQDLPAGDHTPILETMLEATRYWRGDTMLYGYTRDGQRDTRLSHPGSYCTASGACEDALENDSSFSPATDEWGVQTPNGSCDPDVNLDASACSTRNIKGTTNINYISPFDTDSTCQSNYQILLTDGSLYDGSGNASTTIINNYGASNSSSNTNLTKTNSCYSNNSSFKAATDTSRTYDSSGSHIEKCSADLAEFMNEVDQNSTLDNNQTVETHTIAFDLNSSSSQAYLTDIANLGGGEFNAASSAADLINIFTEFLAEVRNVPTSFVAPSLATNAFNRLLSRDEIYFGLFTPENDIRWPGNAKKFNICVDLDGPCSGLTLGRILDATDVPAIDLTDFRFFDTSQSHWSSLQDGGLTTVGGAGAEITLHHQTGNIGTKIYSEVGGSNAAAPVTLTSGDTLNQSGYVYQETGSTSDDWTASALAVMRDKVCDPVVSLAATSAADYLDCKDRMQWLLGKKITTGDDDISTDQRWSVTDVLHSSPSIITYGGSDSDADGIIDVFFDKLVYGTNDGALHMVNPSDGSGKEDWRYIPFDFLSQQKTMFSNDQGTHIYGLDSTPVIRIVDNNGNGIIQTTAGNTDKVHVYIAERRGGDQIYALDLSQEMSTASTEIVPKFLWKIDGGVTSGYGRLGQTWSRPTLAKIQTSAGIKTVLIFGGGYDTGLDTVTDYGIASSTPNDNQGNAIYIADADTGAKILSISGSCTSGCTAAVTAEIDIKVAEMQFSIPSQVTVLDSDGDGLDDRIYVGDTGGQVWRVDLGADLTTNTAGSTVVGRLASIADSSAPAGYRRFFEPPSVVQVRDTTFADSIGNEYDYVLLGTGVRPHPLDEDTEDRFYAFRDTAIGGMDKQATNNEAENYPVSSASPPGDGVPISHSVTDQLVDITTQTLEDAVTAGIDVGASLGWFFDFNDSNTVSGSVVTPGEKVLSAAVTIGGTVFFTTYVPGVASSGSACEGVEIGSGRGYNLDILTTKAVIDWDSTGDPVTGRSTTLGGGIPSDVVPIFTAEGVVGIVGVEGGATQLGTLSGLPRFRTYWYEES
jgi:type IV pilus assembly protein PilY1